MESWILFALLAPAIISIVNIIDKFIVSKRIKNVNSYYIIVGIWYVIISTIIILYGGFQNLLFNNYLFLLTGMILSFCFIMYFKILQIEEVSRSISLTQTFPLLIALFAFLFLGERFNLVKYIGIFSTVIGALIISFDFNTGSLRKAVKYIIIYVFFLALLNILYKYSMSDFTFWQIYSLTIFIAGILITLFGIIHNGLKEALKNKNVIKFTILSELLTITGSLFYLKAVSIGTVTLASALTTIQPLYVLIYATILSIFFPKIINEFISKKDLFVKLAGALFVTIGCVLLTY